MSNWETTQALLASAARIVTGVGAGVDLGTRDRLLRQTLAITAVAGTTPSLAVALESSPDNVGAWRKFGAFTTASTVTSERLTFVAPDRYVRLAWTIGGTATPSFTFGVTGTRGIAFASLDDLDAHGIPLKSLATISASKQAEALAATTEEMSGRLSTRFDLPIEKWGSDIVKACCKITAYELLSVKGFKVEGDDANVRTRYNDATSWINDVVSGLANPVGIVDSTAGAEGDGAVVVTHAPRAWR